MKRFKVIKSIFEIFAVLFLSVLTWAPTAAMSNLIAVTVDGQTVMFDQPAVMSQGRVMVPLRGVFEKLGAAVNYDAVKQNVTASRGTTQITLFMNSPRTLVNGTPGLMDVRPIVVGSRVLVPLRFVSETLGADVKWQAYNHSVNILSQTGGVDLPALPAQQQPAQTSGAFQLLLTAPTPASALPQSFDILGTTQSNATVRINVTADKGGLLGMGGSKENLLTTTTKADSAGNYVFHVNTGNLASGSNIVATITASNKSGGSSNELRIEYSRGN